MKSSGVIALSSHTRVAFIAVAKVKAVAKAKACEQGYSQQIREQAYGLLLPF